MTSAPARTSPGTSTLGEWSWCLGFLLMGIASTVLAAARIRSDAPARVWFHVFDILHFGCLGLFATAITWAVWRATRNRRARAGLTAALSVALGLAVLTPDLRGPALRVELWTGFRGAAPLLAVAVASLVPLAELVGRQLARARLRRLALAVPLVAAPLNLSIFTHLHPGAHLFLAIGSAAVIAGAYIDYPRAWRPVPRSARGVLVSLCLLSLVLQPPPKAGTLLSQVSGSVLYPFLARVHAARARSWLPDPMPEGPWFEARGASSPVEPSSPGVDPKPLVTILLSIDAMRADVLRDPAYRTAVPTLAELADRGVLFSKAWSPSNSTVPSLTSILTGKYYSQVYWSRLDDGTRNSELWPHADESVRFPALLSSAGIRTATYAPAYWLVSKFGVVRGFDEETWVQSDRSVAPRHLSRWTPAEEIIGSLCSRLRKLAARPTPSFFFVHLLEAHYPYDQGRAENEDDFSRYLAELAVVDIEIGKLLDELASLGLSSRTAIVVMADHGEAFGEHSTTKHDSTVYDEIVRVPLLFVMDGVEPRIVDTPVSLIDLGPTLLDLYGIPTPAEFMGQSLVPFLRGNEAQLTRPVAIEARPLQGMVFADGTKIIRNLESGLLEAYDIEEDPEELENLHGGFVSSFEEYFGQLAAFFHVHELRKPGYKTTARRR